MHIILPCRVREESLMKSVSRIINIWEERGVFEQDTLTRLKALLGKTEFLGGM